MGTAYWILTTTLLVAMASLIITLNHLSHKEYSEELDRLRRDLLAGQRVALRYEDSILEQTLRRNEELLQQATASLRQCSARLQIMTASLHRSRPAEEQEVPNDSYRWREKLAHKRSIQEDNSQMSRDFRNAFSQKLSEMEENLESFTQEELKFCLAFKKSLADNLHRRSVELSTVSEQVAALVESQTQVIQDVEKHSSEQASNSQQWVQQLLSLTRATSDSEASSLHNFLTDSFLPVMQNLQHQLLLHKSEIQGLSRQLNEQLRQHVESLQTFSASQSDSLAQLRDSVLQQVLEQQRQLERARELGRGLQRAERALDKDLSSQLIEAVKHVRAAEELWKSHRQESNQTIQEVDSSITVAYDTSDRLLHSATTGLDSHIKRVADISSNIESRTDDVLENVSGFVERSTSTLGQVERYRDDMEVEVRGAISASEGTWREHYHRMEQDLRKLSESLRASQQNEQEHRQLLVGALRESAETHEATLEQQRLDFSTFVRDRQDDLESQCSYASDWSHAFLSELRQRDQDMEVFLNEGSRGYSRSRHRGVDPLYRPSYPHSDDRLQLLGSAADRQQMGLTPAEDTKPSKNVKDNISMNDTKIKMSGKKPRRRMDSEPGKKTKSTSRKPT
ncbi:coiled-coil domain-containing protein 18 isoform X2 [Anabrus simplex]|uniref:coiled-coil domain-containing protein 18 isoform X2 n=1 Tax=Anabrus simplex TaxID=316456 RepID=UPI0035A3048B